MPLSQESDLVGFCDAFDRNLCFRVKLLQEPFEAPPAVADDSLVTKWDETAASALKPQGTELSAKSAGHLDDEGRDSWSGLPLHNALKGHSLLSVGAVWCQQRCSNFASSNLDSGGFRGYRRS